MYKELIFITVSITAPISDIPSTKTSDKIFFLIFRKSGQLYFYNTFFQIKYKNLWIKFT